MRLWIAYRADVLGSNWREFVAYARSKKPDIRMEFNGEALAAIYNHAKMGVDFDQMLPVTWAFWGEDGYPPAVHDNGCIGGRFRSMKMAEAYGSHFFGYAFDGPGTTKQGKARNRLLFAEHLAFNNDCVADMGGFDEMGHLPDFRTRGTEMTLLRDNEDAFVGARTIAEVAVFRNAPSQAYSAIDLANRQRPNSSVHR